MAPTSDGDQPLPLRELARRAEISDGTLRNWVRHHGLPRRSRTGERHPKGVTINDLRAFCAAHAELWATRTVLAHLDNLAANLDTDELRAVLGAVVTAVHAATAAHLHLAQTSAGQAENVAASCRAHAAALAAAVRGLDDALTRISQPPPPDRG
jgi:transposase-like protein